MTDQQRIKEAMDLIVQYIDRDFSVYLLENALEILGNLHGEMEDENR